MELARGIESSRASASKNNTDYKSAFKYHQPVGIPDYPNLMSPLEYGAGERNRTPDRLITNQLLYRLSYASITRAKL
jgi:hypothetical protein